MTTLDFETGGHRDKEERPELLLKQKSSKSFLSRRMSSHSIDERGLRKGKYLVLKGEKGLNTCLTVFKGSVWKIMVNNELMTDPATPYMSHSINWEDEALIKPLK